MERYKRQKDLIPKEIQEKIAASRVLIAGLGGLGSSIIQNLAALGFENFGLLDFDKVEISNLNRQTLHSEKTLGQYKTQSAESRLEEFNSRIKTEIFNEKFEEENASALEITENFDIIFDCFDNWQAKFLLNKVCVKNNKPLIFMGVERLSGQVFCIVPKKSACLNCFLNTTKPETDKNIIAPIVNIIGALGANEALKLFTGEQRVGQILKYDLSTNSIKKIEVKKNPLCGICS